MTCKANDGRGDHEGRDGWETPEGLYVPLNVQYGFGFDCCASEDNAKTQVWTSDFESFARVDVVAWMNPPFSKSERMFKHFFKIVKSGVAIYRCDNLETRLWQEVILKHADWIFIPQGRVNYEGMDGKGSRFPSALIGIGLPPPEGLDGTTLKIKKTEVFEAEAG